MAGQSGEAIVTADADGQHAPEDIERVAAAALESPEALVLGSRAIPHEAPLRSRFGNRLTRGVFRALHGLALADTQTGLRAVPRRLAQRMLRTHADGYELETDMLIAARRLGLTVIEAPIPGRYFDGNASSHFHPLLDSMRIYFVLLRFAVASLATAVVDNLVFYAALENGAQPLPAQAAGRLAAVALYFVLNRDLVFQARGDAPGSIGRYLAVVAGSGALSYGLLSSLHALLGTPIMASKLLAESAIFFANFLLLRDFVFRPARPRAARTAAATDWDSYYRRVPLTARWTRRYTARCIVGALRRAGLGASPTLVELGGANSCFLDAVRREAKPAAYHVIDANGFGLELLAGRGAIVQQADILEPLESRQADLAFSIGLIEHFDRRGTARAVEAHFDQIRDGGWTLLSFPTPTLLYRAVRGVLEACGLWRFPDERPLERDEVLAAASRRGELVWQQTLWPLLLTQHMMLFRARPAALSAQSPAAGPRERQKHSPSPRPVAALPGTAH